MTLFLQFFVIYVKGDCTKEQASYIKCNYRTLRVLPEPDETWMWARISDEMYQAGIGSKALKDRGIIEPVTESGGDNYYRTDPDCYARIMDYVSE